MKHNGLLLWLYFWFNLDFSLIFVCCRIYQNYRFMLKLPLIDTIVGVNQGDPYLSSCLTAHRYRIIVSAILRQYTPRVIIFVFVHCELLYLRNAYLCTALEHTDIGLLYLPSQVDTYAWLSNTNICIYINT